MRASCAFAAGVAAVLLLGGCSSEDTAGASAAGPKSEASATPGSEGSFDVEAALEKAGSVLYSARVTTRSYVGSAVMVIMAGRMNLGGEAATGTLTVTVTDSVPEDQRFKTETIPLEDATYTRTLDADGTGGPWQRTGGDSTGADVADYGVYARLLLDSGPSARKGEEAVDGAPAHRLSGTITAERLRALDRRLYDRMRTADMEEFACDVWVGESGRVVRFEQWVEMSGRSGRNVVTFGDFGEPEPVSAPE
ncbi:hypothetical protein [Streptomyces sp. NPDC007904]|jgi:hypothetical protein|uniref:hypothetical protein n=1 Tax=Streptomyces sp. NPDC007904 TaxID=3364787 RepID=UPI0036EFEEDE